MKLVWVLFLGAIVAGSQARMVLEDGKEYTYRTTMTATAGTMDYASANSGFGFTTNVKIQVNGKTMYLKFTDVETSQFVGTRDAREWPFDRTVFTPAPKDGEDNVIAITTGDDGLFESLEVPSDAPLFTRNLARAWAAQLQVNTKEIKAGNRMFKSREQVLQGNCDISYTVSPSQLFKTVSHTDDCDDRVYRLVDDYRGMICTGKADKGMGYPSSMASTVFVYEKKGESFDVKRIVWTSSFVAQFFGEEGAAQIVFTNSTSDLVEVRSSPGDLSVSGTKITDLAYEFADTEYKWDADRDLKAREPLFTFGQMVDEDPVKLQEGIKKAIAYQKKIIETNLSEDKEALQKAHQWGINNVLPLFYAMDYDSLKSLADELLSDKSDTGMMMSNVFGELLGSAGTTASALVVRDLILENKFDNERDAARILTSVPFHIRRPNVQLVKEFEKLWSLDAKFLDMAVPLTMGHMVRMVCERAGPAWGAENKRCISEFASSYVEKGWKKFQEASDREKKSLILAALQNGRFGGQSKVLQDLILGKTEEKDDIGLRVQALWASFYDSFMTNYPTPGKMFLTLFVDRSQNYEIRIAALEALMWGKPDAATMATITSVLFKETDYEVTNYAFALMERISGSLNPCRESTSKLARFFLKYMKQYSNYETDYGFGVSKTYARSFTKEKFGYGGGMAVYVIGSKRSTTPVALGIGVSNDMMDNYMSYMLGIHLRIEGLAKAVIKKFKTTDPSTWKTSDLQQILSGDMQIRERPDQPIRVQATISLKGNVIVHRVYDENDLGENGKIGSLMDTFKDLGEQYSINHQRAAQLGALLYEQPTNIGFPMAVISSVTTLGSIKATVKRGNHRGLLFRDVKYDVNFLTQGLRGAFVLNPYRGAAYGIVNNRLYHVHIPRKFVIGVNPLKKELKFSINRPEYDHPLSIFMHSQTEVMVRGNNMKGEYSGLEKNCPSCSNRVIVSKGPEFVTDRVFYEKENEKMGYYVLGKYFGCEMDVSRGNTIRHLIGAFSPFNKSPRDLKTGIMMGLRQIRAFFFYFPKTEQCGIYYRWSQSQRNPVNEIEIAIRANMEENGNRLFFSGRKWFIKALIKAKGEPEDRAYRVNIAYSFTPGYLQNDLKIQINRGNVDALDIPPYSICFALENEFPAFSREFLDYDKSDMSVTGKAMVQYGATASCSDAEGEIKVNFKHSTTQEAREELKKKWYYKECMKQADLPEWSGRDEVPLSEACYNMVYDATNARKYTWNVEFVKLTNRMKRIVSKVRSAMQAGLLPYWDVDVEDIDDADGDIGPFLNLDVTLKNGEKNADIKMETRLGEDEFNDVPLRLNWSNRLRNLKFTSTMKRLLNSRIINPCIVTTGSIRTNDNVTIPYEPSKCWTLTSASCGPDPSYAVFTKKSGSKLSTIIYLGGHNVEFENNGGSISVKLNGAAQDIPEEEQIEHVVDGVEILKIFRWGSTYHVYSSLRVWMAYDGTFVEVVPAPSVKGQHCGICGNYNRNKFDELTGKDEELLSSPAELVENWKWKC